MHFVGSMTGCNEGGSVMLAAMASSAARMLADSLRQRLAMYQTRMPITGTTYRLNSSGFMFCLFAPAEKMLTTLSHTETGSPSQFCVPRRYQQAGLAESTAYDLTEAAI